MMTLLQKPTTKLDDFRLAFTLTIMIIIYLTISLQFHWPVTQDKVPNNVLRGSFLATFASATEQVSTDVPMLASNIPIFYSKYMLSMFEIFLNFLLAGK